VGWATRLRGRLACHLRYARCEKDQSRTSTGNVLRLCCIIYERPLPLFHESSFLTQDLCASLSVLHRYGAACRLVGEGYARGQRGGSGYEYRVSVAVMIIPSLHKEVTGVSGIVTNRSSKNLPCHNGDDDWTQIYARCRPKGYLVSVWCVFASQLPGRPSQYPSFIPTKLF
jgi:hypothetical protein